MRKRTSSSVSRPLMEDELIAMLVPELDLLPDALLRPLFNVIGGTVLVWGMAESSLHLMCTQIFGHAGGKAIEPRFPRPLSRKARFLRTCFGVIETLKPLASDLSLILDDVAELGDERHGLIHAYISGYNPETERVQFTSLDTERDGHLVTIKRYTIDELRDLCTAIGDLAFAINSFSGRVQEAMKL